jgi:hypothetical protein
MYLGDIPIKTIVVRTIGHIEKFQCVVAFNPDKLFAGNSGKTLRQKVADTN